MARRLPSLNALRAFEAAGRLRSLTGAAGELSVSHAAVSRHVRDLELWMGIELLRRQSRGVDLTDAGRDLLGEVTQALDILTAAVERTAVRRGRNRLRVSVEESFATRWLVPRLGAFIDAHPEIDLTIDPGNTLVDFVRDSYDLGIRWGGGNWPGVVAMPLAESIIFPVCAPLLLADGRISQPADLVDATLLHDDARELWSAWLATAGLAGLTAKAHVTLKGNLAVSAAEAGQGFALGDAVLAGDSLRAGRLVRPFATTVKLKGYHFVRGEVARPSTTADAFQRFIEAEMAGHLEATAAFTGRH